MAAKQVTVKIKGEPQTIYVAQIDKEFIRERAKEDSELLKEMQAFIKKGVTHKIKDKITKEVVGTKDNCTPTFLELRAWYLEHANLDKTAEPTVKSLAEEILSL